VIRSSRFLKKDPICFFSSIFEGIRKYKSFNVEYLTLLFSIKEPVAALSNFCKDKDVLKEASSGSVGRNESLIWQQDRDI
jgi:hypothetical protein